MKQGKSLLFLFILIICSVSFGLLMIFRVDRPSRNVVIPSNVFLINNNDNQINKDVENRHSMNIEKETMDDKRDNQCIYIDGYSTCGFFKKAKCAGERLLLSDQYPNMDIEINGTDRAAYLERLPKLKEGVSGNGVQKHSTSPFVRYGCSEDKYFIGGATEFIAYAKREFPMLDLSGC